MFSRKPKKQITQREIAAINNFHSLAFSGESVAIPAKRAKPVAHEHIEQTKVIRWWSDNRHAWQLPEIALYANANGGHRHLLTAVKMKAEGVRAGVSDLTLAVARHGYHSAYVEMKAEHGVESEAQKSFRSEMEKLGHRCVVCYGAQSAIKFISDYLGEPHGQQK